MVGAALNPSWLFNTSGYLDAWIYTSLSRTWANPDAWTSYYKTSRLGWVLPAWLMHPVTGGYWGHLLVTAALIVITGATIGIAVSRLVGSLPGALAGLLSAGWGSLQVSGGADYHNQMAGVWLGLSLLALAALKNSRITRRQLLAAGASGVSFGLAVHASPIMINLAPFVAVFAAAALWRTLPKMRRALALGGAWIAGGAAATLALALASVAVSREFLFFLAGADAAAGLVADASGQKAWWKQISWDWPVENQNMVGYAWHLPLVLIGAVAAVALVVRWRFARSRPPTEAALIAAGVLFTGLIFTAWHVAGQTSLQPSYFTYPLGLCTAIGVALSASRTSETSTDRQLLRRRPRSVIAYVVLGLAFSLPLVAFPLLPDALGPPPSYWNWFVPVLLGLGAVGLLTMSIRVWAVVVAVFLLGSSNLIGLSRIGFTQHSWAPTSCRGDQGRVYAASVSLSDWAEETTGLALATGVFGPVLWWPGADSTSAVAACGTDAGAIGLQNVGLSLAQLGFDSFPGYPTGEPRAVNELPTDTLATLARDAIPTVILTTNATPAPQLARSTGFSMECHAQRSWEVDDGHTLNACVAFTVPLKPTRGAAGTAQKGGVSP